MLQSLRGSNARYVVLTRRADPTLDPFAEFFANEEEAVERWRYVAVASIVGIPVNRHLLISARLFVAADGHLRLLETSHPLTLTAPAKERVTA